MRSLRLAGVVAVAALVAVPLGAAKGLDARFEPATANAGDRIVLDLGDTQRYLSPFRIYLVAVENAQEWRKETDPAFIKLGVHGKPGSFGPPPRFEFVVPDIPPGEYYAAVWFKGYASDRWQNVLTYPLLTIDDEPSNSIVLLVTATAVAVGLLVLGAVVILRRSRRPTHRTPRTVGG